VQRRAGSLPPARDGRRCRCGAGRRGVATNAVAGSPGVVGIVAVDGGAGCWRRQRSSGAGGAQGGLAGILVEAAQSKPPQLGFESGKGGQDGILGFLMCLADDHLLAFR